MSEGTPARVLVVDDDRLLLDGLRRQLHGTFDLATALGGYEGLDVLRTAGQYSPPGSEPEKALLRNPGFQSAGFHAGMG